MHAPDVDGGPKRHVVFGAFKGFGDLLSAAPTITAELDSGGTVSLLIFPVLESFVPLVNFGANAHRLRPVLLPVSAGLRTLRKFAQSLSTLSPDLFWISPHAVRDSASWKIPLMIGLLKRCYWPRASIAGAASEPLSGLFDIRVPINRNLPLMQREWTSYRLATGADASPLPRPARFVDRLSLMRKLAPLHDVTFHPGASWPNKKWPHESCVRLLRRLGGDLRVVIVGFENEVDSLRDLLPEFNNLGILVGSIEDVLTTMARSRVVVTMDSGAMHFATALGLPTIALFGPTDPHAIINSSPSLDALFEARLNCQPCYKPKCSQQAVFCMQLQTPLDVERRVRTLLSIQS